MNAEQILKRLRRFLLALSGLLLAGALIELSFTGHTEEPLQWIPFFLCGLGILSLLAVLVNPQRNTYIALRVCMGIIILGSIFGTYEHIANNLAFQLEIHPDLSLWEQIVAGLGGANPLLAPGILGIAAVLALAANFGQSVRRPQLPHQTESD